MLDFLRIKHRQKRSGEVEVWPDWRVGKFKDLMIRGNNFYAVWNYKTKMWSTDEYDVQVLVDQLLDAYAEEIKKTTMAEVHVKHMRDFSTNSWSSFRLFISKVSDQSHQLDEKVTFSNTEVLKSDYVSRRLSYPLEEGSTPAFDRLFGTLYSEDELRKLMWAIGSIVSGDSSRIQKFFVLYGSPGTGKSTSLNLIQSMFPGYYTTFEASALTSGSSGFSTETFRTNPLIGINHEGDLSKIRDNSILNSVVAHDEIVMNIKYHKAYPVRLNTMLFIATNKPVTITDARSGLIRRMIDIHPTGVTLQPEEYDDLISQIEFELGGIAYKCLAVFNKYGRTYYNRYKPLDMMFRTNVFFNFVDEHYYDFARDNWVTLSRAWELYNAYCDGSNITYRLKRYQFRDELKSYWHDFHDHKRVDGTQYRSVYTGFNKEAFSSMENPVVELVEPSEEVADWLEMKEQSSKLDELLADQKAQYGGTMKYWDNVKQTLSDLDTKKLHYVLPTSNLITIDFDIKTPEGEKSLELNLDTARKFPPTYAEISQGGQGLHLHYYYEGDPSKLSRIYEQHIEVLPPVGKFSIRRRLSLCNDVEIATISSGLPLKGDNMISSKVVQSERGLRTLILRSLQKGEIHAHTTPNVHFIDKILREARDSGMRYDVSDLKSDVLLFASGSTNNSRECIQMALAMPFTNDPEDFETEVAHYKDDRLVFYDVEVFPNLFLICWKFEGENTTVQRMYNPTPEEVGKLLKLKLVGFNNRRYDNHMLYARFMGVSVEGVYELSQRIIEHKDRSAYYLEAYNLSYVDIHDYSSRKQTLKQWQIEMGIIHKELDMPWNEPVPKDKWTLVAEYCDNDVIATEKLHNYILYDFHARQILAELSGLEINRSTATHCAQIIFGKDRRKPQGQFIYPDLSLDFPGYKFERGVSTYRGETVGEGGYNYSEPGIYQDVLYADITSMHPFSLIAMNLFGPVFTARFKDLVMARVAIKNKNFEGAGSMFGGALKKYLKDPSEADKLAYALKIAINIVYGNTAASYDNPFRDIRNIDNVVAKRGALFMIDLKHELKARGVDVIHVKTDSIKILNYTPEDVSFFMNFGKKYGYNFEIEGIFEKMVLLNDSDLAGKWSLDSPKAPGTWDAVGARLSHPYVFKQLFTGDSVTVDDVSETRSVKKGNMFIKMPDESKTFIGKTGKFIPVLEGGELIKIVDGKEHAVSDTKGFQWVSYDEFDGDMTKVDLHYYNRKVDDAVGIIQELGDPRELFDKEIKS
jgi:phage/plasmid-associated DNA primase